MKNKTKIIFIMIGMFITVSVVFSWFLYDAVIEDMRYVECMSFKAEMYCYQKDKVLKTFDAWNPYVICEDVHASDQSLYVSLEYGMITYAFNESEIEECWGLG